MGKSRPPVGSLNSMASSVREKKAAEADSRRSRPGGSQKIVKSKEFVEDTSSSSDSSDDDNNSASDSEADLDAARKKLAEKIASKNKVAEAKVNGATSAEAKTTTSTTRSPPEGTKSVTTSSTSTSESESASESDDSDAKENVSSNAVTKKKEQSDSESESDEEGSSESESEEEEEKVEEVGARLKSKNQTTQPTGEAESSSEESDSDASDASEESSHKETHSEKVGSDQTAVARVNGDTVADISTSQISRAPWLNNSDYTIRKALTDNPGKEITEFFSQANLEGKQVWYFTAPASLPITVLQDMEIDLSKATTGGALLNHDGDDYGLGLESNAISTEIRLLIPSQGGDKYTTLNRGIDSTIHLRRIAKFGPGGDVSATATEDYTPLPKPIREQPKGLKPRFTPIGVPTPAEPESLEKQHRSLKAQSSALRATSKSSEPGSESESDSDQEMTEAPLVPVIASSIAPNKSERSSAVNGQLKRKHSSGERQSTAPTKVSKSPEKSAKRAKTTISSTPILPPKSSLISGSQSSKAPNIKRETPIQAPTPARAASVVSGTPSKEPVPATKDKTKKRDKLAMPNKSSKQTPIPPPTLPSIKH
ncbi:DNA-directed RNA polymerase I subunit RPA34.5-domain-containing protein [Xylariaceae sp. FL0662B]|nr:DNA-directed RNA polymerase I subunit RPA34.5-domain-containing protein [Xylariaceae sp. FL0662B]